MAYAMKPSSQGGEPMGETRLVEAATKIHQHRIFVSPRTHFNN